MCAFDDNILHHNPHNVFIYLLWYGMNFVQFSLCTVEIYINMTQTPQTLCYQFWFAASDYNYWNPSWIKQIQK